MATNCQAAIASNTPATAPYGGKWLCANAAPPRASGIAIRTPDASRDPESEYPACARPVLARCVKEEIVENLQSELDETFAPALAEQHRHLLAVLLTEVARIQMEKPAIDAL